MQPFPKKLTDLAEQVVHAARAKKIRIVTAESCTGGLITGCLTEVPGVSDVLDRGYITYSYDAKMSDLGVLRKTLTDTGAVSPATALEMAEGALTASSADIALSATGIAGPGGATPGKPVGLVYLGIACRDRDKNHAVKNLFTGNRTDVRLQTVEAALNLLKKEVDAA